MHRIGSVCPIIFYDRLFRDSWILSVVLCLYLLSRKKNIFLINFIFFYHKVLTENFKCNDENKKYKLPIIWPTFLLCCLIFNFMHIYISFLLYVSVNRYADILKHSLRRQNVWMFLYDMYFIHSTAWLFLFNLFWKSFHFAAAATCYC